MRVLDFMIKVKDLTKSYNGFLALDAVNFEIGRGEVIGFLGPNGAGKSTTLRILTGYLSPTSGNAWIEGQSILAIDEAYRYAIGYLPEGAPTYPEMSVLDYLRFVAKIRKIPSMARAQSISRVLDRCGLNAMRDRLLIYLTKFAVSCVWCTLIFK